MKIITFLLLAYSITALYEHQVGYQDWVIRQYGELNHVTFGPQIYFNSKSSIGSISKDKGAILYTQQHQDKFVKCLQEVDELLYVFYDDSQKRITLYKQKENTFKILIVKELQGELQYCLILKDQQFALVTTKQIIIVDRDNTIFNQQLKEDQKVIESGFLGQIPSLLVKNNNKICVYLVEAKDEILTKQQCNSNSKGVMNVKLMQNAYLYFDDQIAFLIDAQQTHSLNAAYIPLLQKMRTIFPKQNAFLSKVDFKYNLYNIKPNEDPELIHEFPNSVAFDQSSDSRNNINHYYYVKNDGNKVYFNQFDASNKQDQTLGIVDVKDQSRPFKVFMKNYDNNKKVFLVQNEDLHTYSYSTSEKAIIWHSEQSLSKVAAVVWEPFSDERSHKSSYFESLDKNGPQNPLYLIQNIFLRYTNDVIDLYYYAQNIPSTIKHFVAALYTFKLKGIGQTQNEELKEYDITYGLRQKILIVTQLKTILCYNSVDGELLWKDSNTLGRMDQSFLLKGHFKIELKIVHRALQDNAIHLSHILVYYSQEQERLNIFLLDTLTGEIQQVASQKSSNPVHLQSYMVKHDKAQFDNIVIIINEDNEIITYPKAPLEAVGLGRDQPVVFYNYDETTKQIRGFQFIKDQIVQTWNFRIGSSEEIVKIRSSFAKGQENPRVAIWDDRRVLFKLIDHSNFALLTKDLENNILNLNIINAETGKVIFQGVQKNVDFNLPINLVFDENSVFVTYFNPQQQIYEIWTIESYHQNIEVSFLKILNDYYWNQKEETHLNYFETELQAVFLQQVFGFPLGIKSISIARTRKSLTKKNLLIITPENQVNKFDKKKINSLDRNFVSSRRRMNAQVATVPDDSFESFELPPYSYLLQANYLTVLNYYQELENIFDFYIQPTNLESTSLLLITGNDIFFTRISPDRTYDMIQTDFNYSLLLLTVAFIIGLSYFMRNLAKESKILKVFYSS